MIIIGDVHKKRKQYLKLISSLDPREHTIQIGDFGFIKEHEWFLKKMLCNQHKILFGNHDYLPYLNKKHSLGNFYFDPILSLFAIRGAESVDKTQRILGVDYFDNEQLGANEWNQCIDAYRIAQPKIVVSHDAPQSVREALLEITDKSVTSQGLQACLEMHKPQLWVFAHHHRSIDQVVDGVRFVCLNELETFKLPVLP